MTNQIDRLEGYRNVPGAEVSEAEAWAVFLSQFDGFFFLFCTMGLAYVLLSSFARYRRRRRNLARLRAYWHEQRRLSQAEIGVNPKMRYDAGHWGWGSEG